MHRTVFVFTVMGSTELPSNSPFFYQSHKSTLHNYCSRYNIAKWITYRS